jgi:hypothetical protein
MREEAGRQRQGRRQGERWRKWIINSKKILTIKWAFTPVN